MLLPIHNDWGIWKSATLNQNWTSDRFYLQMPARKRNLLRIPAGLRKHSAEIKKQECLLKEDETFDSPEIPCFREVPLEWREHPFPVGSFQANEEANLL